MQENVLTRVARVLNSATMSTPFNYSGLPIGANARKLSTWQPVIDKMRSKLTSWRRRQLSFGGRICLVKSALSSLFQYFFFLTFFKIPKKVVSILNTIQRNFL